MELFTFDIFNDYIASCLAVLVFCWKKIANINNKNVGREERLVKRVCMVVPDRMVKGGIAAVVNGYRGSQLEKDYKITYVESYKDGNKIDKILKGICGYFHFATVLLLKKPDIVHIHSSFGMSFYRKLPFIYMASWRKVPIINHIHGADFDEFFINASESKKEKMRLHA